MPHFCVAPWISCFRWDALLEVSPPHSAETHPSRLWVQSGVHLSECRGSKHPQRQTWGKGECSPRPYRPEVNVTLRRRLVCDGAQCQKWNICDMWYPTGGKERPWHLDQEEQRDPSDQSRVQHQETSHWWPGRGSHPRVASIGCLTGSLQSLTPPSRSSRTGRFLINLSEQQDTKRNRHIVTLSRLHVRSLTWFLSSFPLLPSSALRLTALAGQSLPVSILSVHRLWLTLFLLSAPFNPPATFSSCHWSFVYIVFHLCLWIYEVLNQIQ